MNFLIASSLIWSPAEIMKLKAVSDVQVAPDNQTVAYVVTASDLERNEYVSTIFKNGSPFKNEASQPRWSPDGKWMAYISKKNLWVVSEDGGSVVEVVQGPIESFGWSPDSGKIAFVKRGETVAEPRDYRKDVAVNRLWVVDLAGSEPRALTPLKYCVRGAGDMGSKSREFDWSPDGKRIVFSYAPSAGLDDHHLEGSLASLEVETGRVTEWEKQSSLEASPRFSPDGQWVAFVTGDGRATYMYDRYVAVRSADGSGARRLAATFNEGCFLSGPNLLGWNQTGSHVLFFEPKGTRFHIALLPLDGGEASYIGGEACFESPSLSYDRSTLGLVMQSCSKPPEAFIAQLDPFEARQVSQVNGLPQNLPETELVSWKSDDGLEIEGLLHYPVGYKPGQKYPLLLVIHGGPMGFFRESFLGTPYIYPYLSFAESGFLILRPNPRGSTGYGKEFRSGNVGDWGGRDYIDLMRGVDHLIVQGIVDEERMGVMGWSYGGYMTAWTVTQTSRFKAASMGAGPMNLVSLSGTTDVGHLLSDYLGEFWENPQIYSSRAPLNFIHQIETPCLIQHGVKDLRVPVAQSYEFQHALEKQGKESTFLIYPDTAHYFEKPRMELDSMEKNLEWFKSRLLSP